MADIRSNPEQDQEHDGASPSEILIEACRRNNVELLQEVIDGCESPEKAAVLLNETKTVLGNHIYHEAALRGNYEIIDILLDQPLFECDPLTRLEGDTPLHSAIRYINSLALTPETTSFAKDLISMMIDAGSDPRMRNKAQLTPYMLTDPRNEELRGLLADQVDIMLNVGDYVGGDEDGENGAEDVDGEGSASDSDQDGDVQHGQRESGRR